MHPLLRLFFGPLLHPLLHPLWRWCLLLLLLPSWLFIHSLYPFTSEASPEAYPTPELHGSLGVVELAAPITLYTQPTLNQDYIHAYYHWDCGQHGQWVYYQTPRMNEAVPLEGKQTFLVHDCQRKQTLATVVDESETGWLKLRLETKGSTPEAQSEGWLPPSDERSQEAKQPPRTLLTWQQFFRLYTKELGFHWLARVPEAARYVRMSPKEDAPLVSVTMVKGMRVLHVRGNWLMVELRDMGQEYPIGWLRWRDDAGNFLIWPNVEPSDAANYKYLAPSNPPDIHHLYDSW